MRGCEVTEIPPWPPTGAGQPVDSPSLGATNPSPTSMSAISRYGERSVLIDVVPGAGSTVAAHLRKVLGAAVVDVVPAGHCVLATFDSPASVTDVAKALTTPPPAGEASPDTRTVVIPVRYDGADLDEVAALVGMTPDDVVAAHCETEYRVDFFGFAPGFAYLIGLPVQLHLPRRATPRTRVPAGAVAIAASYAAIYPQTSPGGWHLLGSTDVPMFNPTRADQPSLLQPGDRVRFECT